MSFEPLKLYFDDDEDALPLPFTAEVDRRERLAALELASTVARAWFATDSGPAPVQHRVRFPALDGPSDPWRNAGCRMAKRG